MIVGIRDQIACVRRLLSACQEISAVRGMIMRLSGVAIFGWLALCGRASNERRAVSVSLLSPFIATNSTGINASPPQNCTAKVATVVFGGLSMLNLSCAFLVTIRLNLAG